MRHKRPLSLYLLLILRIEKKKLTKERERRILTRREGRERGEGREKNGSPIYLYITRLGGVEREPEGTPLYPFVFRWAEGEMKGKTRKPTAA